MHGVEFGFLHGIVSCCIEATFTLRFEGDFHLFERSATKKPKLHAQKIGDYALIGDCETAALVGRNGSIDWLCWPSFFGTCVLRRASGYGGPWLLEDRAEAAAEVQHAPLPPGYP